MPATLRTFTLGCRVNQYETQWVRQGLVQAGYQDALPDQPADLCVVNTCTVTAEGDSKSRQAIRRLHRDNPDARIIVMGCYATRAPDEVRRLPGVVEVVTDKRELPDLLGRFGVIDMPDGIERMQGRHRAHIKVQDGCALRCSYCIIPMVRPHLVSRPVESLVREVETVVDNGFREIVLTGIHLGHYGLDWNRQHPTQPERWIQLSDLLQRLVALPGEFRVRLSSLEATELTGRLLAVMADHPDRIVPHLHLCLQSGSDRILRAMRRRWSRKLFIDRCLLARRRLDLPALTTDLIVGFPGEHTQDFQDSLAACRECGFSKMHIFPFSPRRGTAAASLPDPVSAEQKADRRQAALELERQLQLEYYRQLVGRPLEVLAETAVAADGGLGRGWLGTACRYAPVRLSSEEQLEWQLIRCRPSGVWDRPDQPLQLIA
jgi:threonylcarbamoyladenosine tRNA methylthiotransferase MtaB